MNFDTTPIDTKGMSTAADVPVNQGKMFHFWMLKPSLVIKVWRANLKYSQFFLAFLASIMQITPARKWKVHGDKELIVTLR